MQIIIIDDAAAALAAAERAVRAAAPEAELMTFCSAREALRTPKMKSEIVKPAKPH